jgi:hypothetical protein
LAVVLVAWCSLLVSGAAGAAELEFLEKFSFGDREEALKKLVPGTDDCFYYTIVHHQLNQQVDKAAVVLAEWRARYGSGQMPPETYRTALRRNMLLAYGEKPAETLDFIRRELGIEFGHARRPVTQDASRPAVGSSTLDQELLRADRRVDDVLARQGIGGFSEEGLYLLAERDLPVTQTRELLGRINDPAYPGLTKMILKELSDRHSGGFGALAAHNVLTLDQLKELATASRSLFGDERFVLAWLARLAPADGVDVAENTAERAAWLDRLENFAAALPPVWNSLKAQVLYSRLVHERAEGNYDLERFKKYVALPCPARPGVNPRFVGDVRSGEMVNLSDGRVSGLPAIGSDSDLVHDCLLHFLADADDPGGFEAWFDRNWIRRVHAEARILAGKDQPEKWSQLLGAGELRELRDRVELNFAPQNRTVLGTGEKIVLKLRVKNVERLIVRVHEINTLNFYRQNLRPVGENENLDGIVPAIEKVIEVGGSPYLRHSRDLAIAEIDRPGVYVVELIGASLKARALVRRGKLSALASSTAFGQVFTVFGGQGRVDGATIWFDGREYAAGKDGRIAVPFSSSPGRRTFVVSAAGVSALGSFDHQGEGYAFECGYHLVRESLVAGSAARVLLRPQLTVNGHPASLSRLAGDEGNAPRLHVTVVNADGTVSTQTIKNLRLSESTETAVDFPVRSEISNVSFRLECKIKSGITNKHIDLSASASFDTASGRSSAHVAFLHLDRDAGGYRLRLLGRNGEPRPGVGVSLALRHRCIGESIHTSLVTDENGVVTLGALEGISAISAGTSEAPGLDVKLDADNALLRGQMEMAAGEASALAWPLDYVSLRRPRLLELRGGGVYRDVSEGLKLQAGSLELPALEAGAYLLLPAPGRSPVAITVMGGRKIDSLMVSDSLAVEVPRSQPLFIESVALNDGKLTVKLNRGGEFVRVHVLGTRLVPGYDALARLGVGAAPFGQRLALGSPRSSYLSGVAIDGEYRYILERRFAQKYPGNMLGRPSLLLCPWDIDESQSQVAEGAAGGHGFRGGEGAKRAAGRHGGDGRAEPAEAQSALVAPLDFLASLPAVLANLDAGKDGKLELPLKDLEGLQCVEILAVDPENLVRRRAWLPAAKVERRDLRMRARGDYTLHFVRHNAVEALGAGDKLALDGQGSVAVYASIEDVWTLYRTLLPDGRDSEHLDRFSFLLGWTKLKPEKQLELYSEFASHELNFWLYMKDRDFFNKTIKPHLVNKVDKTFLDEWLLEADLAGYARPDRFERLNAAERALLCRRLRDRVEALRAERERVSVIPLDHDRLDRLFDRALGALALVASPGRAAGNAVDAQDHFETASVRDTPMPSAAAPAPPGVRRPSEEAMKRVKAEARNGKDDKGYFAREMKEADDKPLFRQVETTRVWAESNWYRLRRGEESPERVPAGRFWTELAAHDSKKPFVSQHIAETASTFSEALLALAVLDLPGTARGAVKEVAGPAVVYRRSENETKAPEELAALTVVQRYFDPADRFEVVDGQRIEKYVAGPVLFRKVYGCVVTAMNASPRTYRTETLLELPAGAIPVSGSRYTQTPTQVLNPYATARWEYYFYFPEVGRYRHYGAHLSDRRGLLTFAGPLEVDVRPSLPPEPGSPWMLVSQDGTPKDVLEYMEKNNVRALDLGLIAFRMGDKAFFLKTLDLLRSRRVYQPTLWSYSLRHNEAQSLREFLAHSPLVGRCGPALRSPLLEVDPVEQLTWEQLEFDPLINSRIHPINGRRHITSDRQKDQYLATLNCLCHRESLSDNERLVVVYHLLLQERIEEALEQFGKVARRRVRGAMQYDYLDACLAFYREEVARARKIASGYAEYPVPRWRSRFAEVMAQAAEIEGRAGKVVDERDRLQQQSALAAAEPSFDFTVEADAVVISHSALESCQVNFYLVDLELLFSRNPFSYLDTSRLAAVRPTAQVEVKLKKDGGRTTVAVPEKLRGRNLMVEVVAAGKRKAQGSFSRTIRAALSENYGQLRVLRAADGRPMPKVYVKVYGQGPSGGEARFIKDGYTDLRGRFEYATVSGLNINEFGKLAILVVAEDGSALVTEAAPPRD